MVFGCSTFKNIPKTEFRGVWVATVVNIDWPKNGIDDAKKQRQDFLELLEFYHQQNFNALIVQVRTAGDALYPSEKAPWSRFLTGKEGEPKVDFEDPLQWMVYQTHKKGMQFHAWFNPYRATFDLDTTILAKSHDFYQHRDWMIQYGKKYYYNPGEPEVWKHLSKIVEEVVVNYDVDGIHFDDYFYPYKISGETFNDSIAYAQYGQQNQELENWRRGNVDSLVKNVHQTIKTHKPWVQLGISPFGVWKNKSTDPMGSDTKAGQTTYEDLFADPLLWMEKGWLDYIVPQAYWSMDYPAASHEKITKWWANVSANTNLYMGNGAYKVRNNADKAWSKKRELPKQLGLSRSLPSVEGNVFFSAKSLLPHMDVIKKIRKRFYKNPVVAPALPGAPKRYLPAAALISIKKKDDALQICLSHYDSVPRYVSVHQLQGKADHLGKLLKKVYLPSNESKACFTLNDNRKNIGVQVIDAFGNKSKNQAIDQMNH
jgi:uncharacterized lipoprotein YddW (UPF0748 family)